MVIRDVQVSESTFGIALECHTKLHEVVPERERKGGRKEGERRGKGAEKEEEGGARSGRELQLTFRVTAHSLAYGLMPQFLSTSFLRARDTFRTKLSSSNSSRN